jgi:CheY-like chemotaxis protein
MSAGEIRQPKVLVVDDHEDTRAMSVLVLRSQGFNAVAADGAATGFAEACSSRPDVIVTDLAMPDGDGWQLVHQLADDERTRDIPVVVVTACGTETVRERARVERCAGFFFKPCAPDALAGELRRLIAERVHSAQA